MQHRQGGLYLKFLVANYPQHCQVEMAAMYNLSGYLKNSLSVILLFYLFRGNGTGGDFKPLLTLDQCNEIN